MGDGLARVLSKQDFNPDACTQCRYINIRCIVYSCRLRYVFVYKK